MDFLCRDCGWVGESAAGESAAGSPRQGAGRCPDCGSPRRVGHAELTRLAIAHLDCDAFYASVEKRDNPAIRDRPVIIGGGRRGVVSAACYVARLYGVRSAMPMFKALAACPEAVVIRPDMEKYVRVGREVRALMRATTPLVEPLSIDEAFLDLGGTERVHHGCPARTLALLARRIEQEIGITVSIGLSYNKFLAKVASDLDKPRGLAVIGQAEAVSFLAPRPVGLIWGVGKALQKRLAGDGIATIGQLQGLKEIELVRRYGSIGRRLSRFSRGEDDRTVDPDAPTKSVSAETTFEANMADGTALAGVLWPLCERVAERLKAGGHAGQTVQLKLKTADFRTITRSHRLATPTQLAEVLYRAALPLLEREADGRWFRLIGVGADDLGNPAEADPADLFDPAGRRRAEVERAIDAVRARHGAEAIGKGRGIEGAPLGKPPRRPT
jgi:DNA polymerase-4